MSLAALLLVTRAAAAQYAFSSPHIESQPLGAHLHVLVGIGEDLASENVVVSIGAQGVLVVDDEYPEVAPRYAAAIGELGGGPIDFVVSTHLRRDQAEAASPLTSRGPWFIAHENARAALLQADAPGAATDVRSAVGRSPLPVVTYSDRMTLYFNGERIELLHVGPANTDGDTAVIFRASKAVALGDIFDNAAYPVIDTADGGSLPGMIAFCEAVLDEIDGTFVVIPGRGPVTDYLTLGDYVQMLRTIHDRMASLIASGATLEQVAAARVTSEWDDAKGDPMKFLASAYASMSQ